MSLQCRSSHLSYCTGTAAEKRLMNLILHLVVPVGIPYWFPELRVRLLTTGRGLLLSCNTPVSFTDSSIRNSFETQIRIWIWLKCSGSWDPAWSSCPLNISNLPDFWTPLSDFSHRAYQLSKIRPRWFFALRNNIQRESISHRVLVVFLLIKSQIFPSCCRYNKRVYCHYFT